MKGNEPHLGSGVQKRNKIIVLSFRQTKNMKNANHHQHQLPLLKFSSVSRFILLSQSIM